MSARLDLVISEITSGLDFTDDAVETLVEKAFIAGATAMDALYQIEGVEDPEGSLTDYVAGIAGLTQSVGGFLASLTDEQEAIYRANLKKVIKNENPNVETALEAFADANLDLTAAVLDVNEVIG